MNGMNWIGEDDQMSSSDRSSKEGPYPRLWLSSMIRLFSHSSLNERKK